MKKLALLVFLLAAFFVPSARAQSPCTTTANVGFQVPIIGSVGWGNCLQTDYGMLDTLLGGTSALAPGTATPSVSGFYSNWITANTGAEAITNFTGGFPGQLIRILCGASDTFTSLASGANLSLSAAWSCSSSKTITLVLIGTVWTETARQGGSGGNVTGPASSQNLEVPLFSGTGGKTLTNSNTLFSSLLVSPLAGVGDAKVVGDAAITSGQAILTSATASFTSGDVGKTVVVEGAGTSGAPLVTTILSFTNSTTVVLAANASTTVVASGLYWGTDNTAKLQTAMNSGFGWVYVPAGTYLVTGQITYPTGTQFSCSSRDFTIIESAYSGVVFTPTSKSSAPENDSFHDCTFKSLSASTSWLDEDSVQNTLTYNNYFTDIVHSGWSNYYITGNSTQSPGYRGRVWNDVFEYCDKCIYLPGSVDPGWNATYGGANSWRIFGNVFKNFYNYGIKEDSQVDDLVVTMNEMSGANTNQFYLDGNNSKVSLNKYEIGSGTATADVQFGADSNTSEDFGDHKSGGTEALIADSGTNNYVESLYGNGYQQIGVGSSSPTSPNPQAGIKQYINGNSEWKGSTILGNNDCYEQMDTSSSLRCLVRLDNGSPSNLYLGSNAGGNLYMFNNGLTFFTDSPSGLASFSFGLSSNTFSTVYRCASSGSPAVCGAAAAGMFTIAAGATSVVVDTTSVTANSEIFVQEDDSLGTALGVTCNTTINGSPPEVTARTAGTSFTVTTSSAPTSLPACYSYYMVN